MATKKRVWLSAIALIVLASFATLAFKPLPKEKAPVKKRDTMYTFYYNSSDFSEAEVERESNWSYTAGTDLCDGVDAKPCRIQVSETYVNNPTSAPSLKTSADISAALNSSTGTHYVDGVADPDGVISNRPN